MGHPSGTGISFSCGRTTWFFSLRRKRPFASLLPQGAGRVFGHACPASSPLLYEAVGLEPYPWARWDTLLRLRLFASMLFAACMDPVKVRTFEGTNRHRISFWYSVFKVHAGRGRHLFPCAPVDEAILLPSFSLCIKPVVESCHSCEGRFSTSFLLPLCPPKTALLMLL